MSDLLLIRADAGPQIGIGHLMRCLALAQQWLVSGGEAIFLSHCEGPALRQLIESAGISFLPVAQPYPDTADSQTMLSALERIAPDWVVLDGYQFDTAYQRDIRRAGARLLVVDDMAHLPFYYADLLLNQNINADQLTYHIESDATLLAGSRYALLRPEFLAWRNWKREIPKKACKLLVAMGGSDRDNVTLKVIEALLQLKDPSIAVRIVVGPANPHLQVLRDTIGGSTGLQLLTSVTDMPTLMAWADLAISAGGSTCWELAFMGLPSLVVVLADNQRGIAETLEASGIAANLGEAMPLSASEIGHAITGLINSRAKRTEMSELGRQLIDGRGAERAVAAITLLQSSAQTRRRRLPGAVCGGQSF